MIGKDTGKNVYTYEARVRYSETDQYGKLTLGAILDYFQDTSTFEAEDRGIGIAFLEENQIVWILSGWQVQIESYPMLGEKIKINTFPYDFKNFFGMRNFYLQDERGRTLVRANTIWTLMDTEKGCPIRIPQNLLALYHLKDKIQMEYLPRKINLTDTMEEKEHVTIREYHLDTNGHVNNAQYVKIANEISQTRNILGMRADYRKAAKLGDVMIPYVGTESGKEIICFKDNDGTSYAVVEFQNEM